MAMDTSDRELFGCPFMNHNDPRCARQFSLGRLGEAFRVCVNGYEQCTIHQRMQDEHARRTPAVRYEGQTIQPGDSGLRRTGS